MPKQALLPVGDSAADAEWTSRGAMDFHCHLDRAYTWPEEYYLHEGGREQFIDAPLWVKQDTVGTIHRGSAFTDENLRARMTYTIEQKIAGGETFLNAITDCTADNVQDRSFVIARQLRTKYRGRIQINVGAYPVFGFKTHDSDRRELIEALAPKAQFLVGLPERDDRGDHPIGFAGHLAVLIQLAATHGIPLQVHLDQSGRPDEDGTERFLSAVEYLSFGCYPPGKRPELWAVHALSPSSYDEERFVRLLKRLRALEVGVIVCPHAALSMRAMRNHSAPIHNLIARIFEMVLAGVRVRLGTDNIRDLFMPRPASPLVSRELDALASGLRFYDENVIYKLVRGETFNNSDLVTIAKYLDANCKAFGWNHTSDRYRP